MLAGSTPRALAALTLRAAAVKGVLQTTVGYTGGTSESPTYGSVCGNDGHTEALRIVFDPSVVSYRRLLEVWASLHSPFHSSSKVQYRSAVWWHSAAQEKEVRAAVADWEAAVETDDMNCLVQRAKVVSLLAPAGAWWDAEERHQKWMAKRGRN